MKDEARVGQQCRKIAVKRFDHCLFGRNGKVAFGEEMKGHFVRVKIQVRENEVRPNVEQDLHYLVKISALDR